MDFSAFDTDKSAEITKVTGKLLFAGYSLTFVLVALNLLIAMLNNSYKKVDVSFSNDSHRINNSLMARSVNYQDDRSQIKQEINKVEAGLQYCNHSS